MDAADDERPVAVVTGAARGIGAEVVRLLVAEGWRVGVVDIADGGSAWTYTRAGAAHLAEVVAAAEAAGGPGTVHQVVADVTRRAAVDDAVDELAAAFGRVDAGVAAAGAIAGGIPAWEEDDDLWDAMLAVNLTGVRNLALAVVPRLLQRPEPRQGRFVAVASSAAVLGLQRLGAYSAAKAGVTGFVRALAADLDGTGVTANAVCPTSTRTAMLDASAALYDLASPEVFAAQEPLGRLLEPAEVAATIVRLCRPEAGAITGQALPVDPPA